MEQCAPWIKEKAHLNILQMKHFFNFHLDINQGKRKKKCSKRPEMWFFYKIIRFLETYALFLQPEPLRRVRKVMTSAPEVDTRYDYLYIIILI